MVSRFDKKYRVENNTIIIEIYKYKIVEKINENFKKIWKFKKTLWKLCKSISNNDKKYIKSIET